MSRGIYIEKREETSTNLSDSPRVNDRIQPSSYERSVVEDEVGLREREREKSEDESVRGGEEHGERRRSMERSTRRRGEMIDRGGCRKKGRSS